MSERTTGIVLATGAYIIWGVLPLYWKLLDHVNASIILSMRIIWAFVFMIILVFMMNNQKKLLAEFARLLKNKRQLIGITAAAFIVSLNWLTYIWAVNNEYVIEASLGYYINPLINVLLGILILKESLTRAQRISVGIAGIGVLYLTLSLGVFPWISFVLAITFALYGLLKKIVDLNEIFGLTIETFIVTPIALIYVILSPFQTEAFSLTFALLAGAGVATAVPLLLFAYGAKRIPLSMIGFLQYFSPTIMLLLGVFVFKEAFSINHLIAFTLIWTALIIYMRSAQLTYRKSRMQKVH
ncbi:MAG TPA: EamA family transporter RarD [Bacillota bacterium]|nr:EamA family transporter RarD [Bacillota bacterium]